MRTALVTYCTFSGTTAETARVVGEELSACGLQVEVRSLAEVASLDGYELVVLGAPMIMGWHRTALKFLKSHRQALAGKKLALFFTAMRLTENGERSVEGVPVYVDSRLAEPPRQPGRLGFKERYATVHNYLRPALKAAGDVRPVSTAFFGGRLDVYRLKWWAALFVLLVIQAPAGSKQNWPAVREWARGLGALF